MKLPKFGNGSKRIRTRVLSMFVVNDLFGERRDEVMPRSDRGSNPLAAVSKFEPFRSFHIASVQSAV